LSLLVLVSAYPGPEQNTIAAPKQIVTEPPKLEDDEDEDGDDFRFEYHNPDFTDAGEPLFESDMVLTAEQRADRQAKSNLWPGVVHFAISPESEVTRDKILAGIDHWRANSCVQFEEVADGSTEKHIRFIKSTGCWSFLGRTGRTAQSLSIGNGCGGLGTVAHEIGHALGLAHQQSRTDRDTYVIVNMDNVQDGKGGNFRISANSLNHSVPYDLTSVMHYGATYFTKNGLKTIQVKDITQENLIGKRAGLTHRDRQIANAMYQCAAACAAPPTCENGGFVDASCTCVCPANTSGERCETKTGEYYPALSCGEEITAPGVITSPNHPAAFPAKALCYWVITAPADQRVRVTFNTMQIMWRNSKGKCKKDYLDLRYLSDVYTTDAKACDDELEGQVHTSAGNQFVVKFKSDKANKGHIGFSATVEFV